MVRYLKRCLTFVIPSFSYIGMRKQLLQESVSILSPEVIKVYIMIGIQSGEILDTFSL